MTPAKAMTPFFANFHCAWLRLQRDRFLASMIGMMLLIGLAIRGLLTLLDAPLQRNYQVDIASYDPLISSYFGLLTPALIGGCVAGFLILESKEEGPLLAIKIARRARGWMLSATLSYAVIISLGLSIAMLLLMGRPGPSLALQAAIILLNAMSATIFALILCIWSDNKVQAFAITKIISTLALAPVLAYFANAPWRFLAGILPFFWTCESWWLSTSNQDATLSLLAALGSTLLWGAVLMRVARKKL